MLATPISGSESMPAKGRYSLALTCQCHTSLRRHSVGQYRASLMMDVIIMGCLGNDVGVNARQFLCVVFRNPTRVMTSSPRSCCMGTRLGWIYRPARTFTSSHDRRRQSLGHGQRCWHNGRRRSREDPGCECAPAGNTFPGINHIAHASRFSVAPERHRRSRAQQINTEGELLMVRRLPTFVFLLGLQAPLWAASPTPSPPLPPPTE